MKIKYIIDRFEGTKAILEDSHKELREIDIDCLPKNAVEGDCLIEENGIYTIDSDSTQKLKAEIDSLIDDLFV